MLLYDEKKKKFMTTEKMRKLLRCRLQQGLLMANHRVSTPKSFFDLWHYFAIFGAQPTEPTTHKGIPEILARRFKKPGT
jgi:hypothetical protein